MTRRVLPRLAPIGMALSLAWAAPSRAQRPAAADTLRLGELQEAAVRRDPRAGQLDLLASQSALRQRGLDAERLPVLGATGRAQYQSDVASIPIELPGGRTPPAPPKETYDAQLAARQRLFDPGLGARREVERAELAESQARLRATLHELRLSVVDAYFAALVAEARAAETRTAVVDLEARLRDAAARVREGAALPSEAATLEAELLRRRQTVDELAAGREAALVVLGDLAGLTVGEGEALALPDLGAEVARARAGLAEVRARPEYERFARTRELLERRRDAVAAADRPRVSAFGRAGYGRPGLDPLGGTFDAYWLTGVEVEWTPWRWGATERERSLLALQERVVATEEAAFTGAIRRAVAGELATLDRLERALGADDAIVSLREEILRETRLRFSEGVVTAAEYTDRETDLLDARLARATHRVELARARARFLTLLGIEIR